MPRQTLPQVQKAPKRWTTKGAVLFALISFMFGIGVGSLSQKQAILAAPVAAVAAMPSPETTDKGGFQTVSPEVLQSMAAPMIAAVKAAPKNAEALIALADFYYDHKMFTNAIEYYERAVAVDPKNVDARTDLGTSYLYLGANDKAISEYEKALRIQPDYPQTLMNLGIARMDRLHDKAGALKAWKHLLEANPDFPQKQQVLSLIAQAEKK